MKGFVTGATGLVGSSLCERLIAEGHDVRALVRPSSDVSFLESLNAVELVRGDMTDGKDALSEAVGDADTVFHTAALVEDWAERSRMVEVNVTGLETLLEACRDKGLKRFVHLSSLAVLGIKPQHDLDETAEMVHIGDNYNYTKILAEKVARRFIEEGLPIVILRPPYMYGPRDRQFLPRLVQPILTGRFRFIGDGSNPLSVCYVDNIVEAMMLAAAKDEAVGQTFIITDGQSVTRRELVELVCDGLGLETPERHVPTWLARAVSRVLELVYSTFRLKGTPILNRFKLKFMHTPLTFNIDKARRVLGYQPLTDTREGLRLSVAWYKEHVLGPDVPPQR